MTAEYSLLPASTGERTQREARARQAGRPHGRDPAADRPRAARGRRLRGARRADALARLRRPPGRRRHALRGDLRRLRRGARARSTASGSRKALAGLGRGGLGRRRRRRARCSTSTTPRTRPPRSDMNVVMTGDGRLVEVQATAERGAVLARAARRAARPRRRRDRGDRGRAARRVAARVPDSRPGRGARCGSRSRPRSAGRSGSSASCASARRGCGRTCSSRVGAALFTLVSAYGFRDFHYGSQHGDRRSTRRGSPRRS